MFSPKTAFAPIPILTYHQITSTPKRGTAFRSLCVSPERFASQMAWLKRLGYQGLSMSDLMPYLKGEKRGKVVGITFDDGYLNNLEHAQPVLQRLGFGATLYAVSALLGQFNVWDAELNVAAAPLMDAKQLRAWHDSGLEVGSHTCHHVHLNRLNAQESLQEIDQSKRDLEDLLGQAVRQFCYPYGEYSKRHVDQVRETGYWAATTTVRSRVLHSVGQTQDLGSDGTQNAFELPRVSVVRSTHCLQFGLKVLTAYEDRRAQRESGSAFEAKGVA